jgi:hypothetical protein
VSEPHFLALLERQAKDSGATKDNTSRPTIGGYSQILITAALLHPEATFQVRSVYLHRIGY